MIGGCCCFCLGCCVSAGVVAGDVDAAAVSDDAVDGVAGALGRCYCCCCCDAFVDTAAAVAVGDGSHSPAVVDVAVADGTAGPSLGVAADVVVVEVGIWGPRLGSSPI